ncbi:MAG: transglutaminase-like domain-containing protein, partial [Stackebrandtia sp.]
AVAPFSDPPSYDEVASLVDELTADQETQYDKVLSIFNYFSRDNGFSYQVRTEDGWSSSAIVDFLHEKQGYCQQYAAAMGWMVRQAEIPARVAIGLTRGSSTNEGYRLTNFNFHAWVEVYFDEIGWVPFDPTPSQGVRTSVEDDWAPDPNRGDEGEGGGDDGTGVDEHGDDNSDDGGGTGEEEGGQQQTAVVVRDGTSPPTIWPYWAAAGAMIALAFLTPMVARATRRRRRLSISNAKTDKAVHAAWKELDDTLVDLGYTVDPSDTPRALGDRLATEAGLSRVSAAGVRHLAAAEAQARYAPRPPEGLTLAHAYRVAKVGLEAGRPPLARLRAWLFPISLLSWWRRGLSRAVDATGNGVIKTRLAVRRVLGRVLPRRGRAA